MNTLEIIKYNLKLLGYKHFRIKYNTGVSALDPFGVRFYFEYSSDDKALSKWDLKTKKFIKMIKVQKC